MGDRELLSLDTHKAFNSVEWQYLWATMLKFGFGPIFLSWVQLLYSSPKVVIREAGHISCTFPLHRGTRQGCPLSPFLFAIAIEPLAAMIRSNSLITEFKFGQIHEKIMLYADDTMLLLGDTEGSLKEAMMIIKKCREFSGLVIIWTKSSIMLLDSTPDSQGPTLQDIPITPQFKYLGVYVTLQPRDYVSLNVCPLLSRNNDKIKVWSKLKMSLVGRVNLTKMIFMPQLLYMLHNTPMVVTLRIFRIINSMFRSFLWLDRLPRIKLEQLQKPKKAGGLALSNPWLYCIAAQLQHIARVIPKENNGEGDRGDPTMALLTQVTGTPNIATGLEALALTKSNNLFPTYVLIQNVWNKVRQL